MRTELAHKVTTIPARGDRLPGFSGKSPAGQNIRLRDFYLRRNLALVFTHDQQCAACHQYLIDLAERRAAVQAEAGEILVVVPGNAEHLPELPCPIVIDDDSEIYRRYGLIGTDDHSRAAIFLVDRYGIVFEASVADGDHTMLSAAEVPKWLEFIACRCS